MMNAGRPGRVYTETVNLVIGINMQSNGATRGNAGRLANTNFAYKGISTGYPNTRTTQTAYNTISTTGLFIYVKNQDITADFNSDNGTWQAYNVGVNSCPDRVASGNPWFGWELSLGIALKQRTGNDVYFIKPAMGGTAMVEGTTSSPAGGAASATWNRFLYWNAGVNYIDRAIRDLKIARPNARIVLQTCIAWQGETDGAQAVPAASYIPSWYFSYNFIKQKVLQRLSLDQKGFLMQIVNLKFNNDANEAVINGALSSIVSANPNFRLVNQSAYPQKNALTAAEAAPVGTGASGDDNHTSYIGQLAVGELLDANIVAFNS